MWAVCRPVVCTPVLVAQQEVGILVRVVCRPAVCRPGVSAPQETCRSLRMIKGTGCACTRLPCHRTRESMDQSSQQHKHGGYKARCI